MASKRLTVEAVSGGHRNVSGPAWHPDGYLLFCDRALSRIYFWTSEGTKTFRRNAGAPTLLAINDAGDLLVAESEGNRITFTPEFGNRSLWTSNCAATSLAWFTAKSALATTARGPEMVQPLSDTTVLPAEFAAASWLSRHRGGFAVIETDGSESWISVRDAKNLEVRQTFSLGPNPFHACSLAEPNKLVAIRGAAVELIDFDGQTLGRADLPEAANGLCAGAEQDCFVTTETTVYRVRFS